MRTALAAVIALFATALFGQTSTCPPRYSYCGYSGPSQWVSVWPDCGIGVQSPIIFRRPSLPASGHPIVINYAGVTSGKMSNSGHDIRVENFNGNGTISIWTLTYRLVELHFHQPGEHIQSGAQAAPIEMHIVHQLVGGTEKDRAVLAVFFLVNPRTPNQPLSDVFNRMPTRACQRDIDVMLNLAALLPPRILEYLTYYGSLTTPECDGGVRWLLLTENRLTVDDSQRNKLRQIGDNARPTSQTMDVSWIRSPP